MASEIGFCITEIGGREREREQTKTTDPEKRGKDER